MPTLLYVKSSIHGDAGQSSHLAKALIDDWLAQYPDGELIERDLVAEPLPHLDGERFAAFLSTPDERTPAQQAVLDLSNRLIEEVRRADILVVGVPMYNFGVPSQLKSWFDHLARAGVTFRYTENGPVGLLDDKPVLLVATRGGLHREAGRDHEIPFVSQFFGFLGIRDTRVIYAEGLSMEGQREQALASARQQLARQLQ